MATQKREIHLGMIAEIIQRLPRIHIKLPSFNIYGSDLFQIGCISVSKLFFCFIPNDKLLEVIKSKFVGKFNVLLIKMHECDYVLIA